MTETNEQLPALPEPQNIEIRDDRAIIDMLTGQAAEDYVYSFQQGGRTVEGLTLAGINEAANRRGGIKVDEVRYEEKESSWLAIARATDTVTGSARYGAYEQPKHTGTDSNGKLRDDPHSFTKAIHKAQRNAIKQLLPVPVIREVLSFYLKGNPTRTNADYKPPSPDQEQAFAIATKLLPDFADENISKTEFWDYMKHTYSVSSRTEMTQEQWATLAATLSAAQSDTTLLAEIIVKIEEWKGTQNDRPQTPDAS